jgi:hypothetical protein
MAKRSLKRAKTKPAPNISAEVGREFRSIAENALTTATAAELPQLVLLFATYADGLNRQVQERNSLISGRLTSAKASIRQAARISQPLACRQKC